jgi:hypothetical protein
MRIISLLVIGIIIHSAAFAQKTASATSYADSTVYDVADNMPFPLLRSCQPEYNPGWTEDSIRRCAERQLLALVSKNILYPVAARENNTEGTVVASFVVEPDGRMSAYKILKDIGNGCGEEALRVLRSLDEAGLRWKPGVRGDKPVRTRQALPLRFKLEEAKPYFVSLEGDSIYTNYDTPPAFKAGMDSLTSFVLNRLQYPEQYSDSCKTGVIELSLLIRPNGVVQVENQIDFNNLGLDFQFEAIRLAKKSNGLWMPAQFQGRSVASTIPLRTLFKSNAAVCTAVNANFDKAMILADEGVMLLEQNKQDEAIAKWTEALALDPNNTELLYYRGSSFLNQNKREEACNDFKRIKELLSITWFEGIRKVVCGW